MPYHGRPKFRDAINHYHEYAVNDRPVGITDTVYNKRHSKQAEFVTTFFSSTILSGGTAASTRIFLPVPTEVGQAYPGSEAPADHLNCFTLASTVCLSNKR